MRALTQATYIVSTSALLSFGALYTASANEELAKMAKNPKDWVMQTGDYANTRYSPLKQITKENVKNLQVKWTFSTGVLRGHEGGPLIVGDVMYVHAPFPNTVYALDLNKDGKILWKYEPKQDANVIPIMCCDTVNRGVAYAPADGDRPAMIFLNQADTNLVALDAKTGKLIWTAKNGDETNGGKGESGTSAPVVVKDKVLVGVSGAEFGVRGWIAAYNLKDGKLAWKAYSEGPDADTLIDPQKTTQLGKPVGKDSGTNTWEGEQWKTGGGTTWGWYSYDPKLNLVYYGTGNPSTWNPVQRPGDNRWAMTIFARDADTGMAKWVYQMTPHDEWDYDGVNEMILVDDMQIKGKKHDVLVHFDRNGFAYTMDRATGDLLVAEKYDPAVNWATKINMDPKSDKYGRPEVVQKYSPQANGEDTNTTGICPAALGTKDQQPATYSPKTGLFYVPTNHVCMDYEPYKVSYTAGQPYVGSTVSMYPAPGGDSMGNLIAWDAAKGEIVWSKPEQFSVWSGALATAGDVVFYGTLEGYLKAVDKNGKELYKFKTPSGIIGNVTPFEHDGKQYIAVLSGVGGWAGIGLAGGLLSPDQAAAWHGAVDQGRAQGDQKTVVGTAGLGAVGGYAALADYTTLGGQLTVFGLPD
ncbi:methanol/ethanol family PQQ-dependent dehydrogenase [Mesorhizobium sp. VK24D]|uniref:Methanol/ethanol family PQQ-dependent dehydrogenase n=1 Tax=Mesorhizobium album TaxID=3072314 RepID=A0ABU4Y2Y9_9HYPH|nr:methanol/ethanol family PQQ-dependent dehydrogenase [Mesorhizobium sp. VK24D]MDX8481101.1 methanol/ethanol family PQQ-dependent dehydrogenase [Mesorhizobium sp. VK24D]